MSESQPQGKTESAARLSPAQCSEKWFSYDPDNGFETHATEEKARANAEESLHWHKQEAADYGWDENVTQICWGKIAQEVVMTSRETKPPPDQLDEDGCDEEGRCWAQFDEIVDYGFSPNDKALPQPPDGKGGAQTK